MLSHVEFEHATLGAAECDVAMATSYTSRPIVLSLMQPCSAYADFLFDF